MSEPPSVPGVSYVLGAEKQEGCFGQPPVPKVLSLGSTHSHLYVMKMSKLCPKVELVVEGLTTMEMKPWIPFPYPTN